jgi:hypothetical protein
VEGCNRCLFSGYISELLATALEIQEREREKESEAVVLRIQEVPGQNLRLLIYYPE